VRARDEGQGTRAGDVGTVEVRLGNEEGSAPIVVSGELKSASLWWRLWNF